MVSALLSFFFYTFFYFYYRITVILLSSCISLRSYLLFFYSSSCLDLILWNKHCPVKIKIIPGTTSKYPINENDPGRHCTPARSTMKLENIGSRVKAKAGMMGSGNILDIMTMDIICPRERMIAMYMNPEKWAYENKLNNPQNELKSNVAPLKK